MDQEPPSSLCPLIFGYSFIHKSEFGNLVTGTINIRVFRASKLCRDILRSGIWTITLRPRGRGSGRGGVLRGSGKPERRRRGRGAGRGPAGPGGCPQFLGRGLMFIQITPPQKYTKRVPTVLLRGKRFWWPNKIHRKIKNSRKIKEGRYLPPPTGSCHLTTLVGQGPLTTSLGGGRQVRSDGTPRNFHPPLLRDKFPDDSKTTKAEANFPCGQLGEDRGGGQLTEWVKRRYKVRPTRQPQKNNWTKNNKKPN